MSCILSLYAAHQLLRARELRYLLMPCCYLFLAQQLAVMILEDLVPWNRLKRYSAGAFFVAGVGYVSHTALSWYEINVLAAPDQYLLIGDLLLFLGFFGSMVGLLGIYPLVADTVPRATGAIAWFLLAGVAAGLVERTAVHLVSLASGTPYGETVTGLEPLFLIIYLSVLSGFLVFGIIGIRNRVPSLAVGVLFLAPLAVLVLHIILPRISGVPDPVLTLFGAYGLALLVVGYLIRTKPDPGDTSQTGRVS